MMAKFKQGVLLLCDELPVETQEILLAFGVVFVVA